MRTKSLKCDNCGKPIKWLTEVWPPNQGEYLCWQCKNESLNKESKELKDKAAEEENDTT
jgi:hypothetical protein